jgi:putative ABC transport system permease protein
MLKGIAHGLRKFWSDLTSGDLLILGLSIVLAVTAISSVSFLGDRLKSSIKQQASVVLGADLSFRSASELGTQYLELAEGQALKTAETVSFLSMAIANEDNLLSSIKATTPAYPLRGKLIITDFNGQAIDHTGSPKRGYLWVEPKLVEQLELQQNNVMAVGKTSFIVAGILKDFPDRNVGFLAFSPTIIANINDLSAMGVIQTGSRVVYRNLFSGSEKNISAFVESIGTVPPEIRVQKIDDIGDQLGRTLDRSTRFFNLAGLFTIIIAAISSMIAARRYANRHLLNTSLMKVFGASKNFIVASQVTQLVLMILIATSLGLFFGYLLQSILIGVLKDLIDAELPNASIKPVGIGFLTSFCLVFGAASPYLKLLSEAEPIRILRNDFHFKLKNNLVIYAVALITLVIFLLLLFEDVFLVLSIIAAMIILAVVLYIIGSLMVYLLSFFQSSSGIGWKLGLKNIVHRRSESVLQIVVFGLSLMFLMVLAETRTDLIDSWKEALKEDTPNYFFFNIQDYELPEIKAYLDEELDKTPVFTPLIRGRLLSVQPKSGELIKSGEMIDREANLTWYDAMPDNNQVVEGSWWSNKEGGQMEVSVDSGIAASMDLSIGDQLNFAAGGTNFTATVSSFREVTWESFAPNFFFVLSPKLGRELPQSFITSVQIPGENNQISKGFVERFPTVTSVDLNAALQQIRSIIGSASLAVQYIFILALIAGILTLIASIFSSADQRKREGAILHTLGAKRSKIFQSVAAEFLVLGLLSGLTAVFAATLFSGFLSSQVFDLNYSPNLFILGFGFMVGVLSISIAGTIAIRKTIYTSPVITLRNS